jgi:hypothetical protein
METQRRFTPSHLTEGILGPLDFLAAERFENQDDIAVKTLSHS